MNRLRAAVDRGLAALLVVLMTAMVGNVLWQIFTRYVLRRPSSYTEELARFLLIWVGLLGAAYALGRGMHLAIDVVVERLGRRFSRATALLAAGAVVLFAVAVMGVGGTNLVRLTLLLEQTSAALAIPLGWVYLALPLAGALMTFYAVDSAVSLGSSASARGDGRGAASRLRHEGE